MTLTTYITNTYGQVNGQLAWDSTDHTTIISKALQMYGVSLEADATDTVKIEALVDYCVWRQALADISLDYAFSADNASFQRQQAVEQVRKNMLMAENAALPYLSDYQIEVHADPSNDDWYEELDT